MGQQHILNILKDEEITEVGVLPLDSCRIVNERLLANLPFDAKSVVLFLIPYYTGEGENISAYAVSEDYHFYTKNLSERILPLLHNYYPEEEF